MSQVTRRQAAAATNQEGKQQSTHVEGGAEETKAEEVYQKASIEEVKVQSREGDASKHKYLSDEPALPIVEIVFYVICIVVIMFKANVMAVYTKSKDHIGDFGSYNLEPGWSLLGERPRDISDFEWIYVKNTYLSIPFVVATVGYVVLIKMVNAYAPTMRTYTGLAFSLVCLTVFLKWKVVGMFTVHTLVTYLASRTRSTVVVWVVMLIQIATLNYEPLISSQRFIFEEEKDYHNFVFGVAICQLRLLSFAIDYCQNSHKKGEDGKPVRQQWSLLDILVYNFYLPLFIGGPVLTYDKFRTQYYQEPKPFTKGELKVILKELLRYVFWMVFTDVALHFLYFPAFQQRKHLLIFLPTWAIGGIALNHLIFFQVKYVVMYGLPRVIGLFDRLDAPLPPICVLGTYLFQDFWRYFDRGLHRLLVSCIYIPLGGSKHGLPRQLLASMLCFGFVYYWHGSDPHLFYWALFNWIGVTLEQLVQIVVDYYGLDVYLKSKLPGGMYRRLVSMLRTPGYICLAASNLVFLAGTSISYIYFDRLILSGLETVVNGIFKTALKNKEQ